MRGHGDTTLKADPKKLRSWHSFRDDLIFLIENSNAPAVLSGHSLGGTASWLAALLRPDLVEKLVLVDPVILPLRYIFGYHLFNFFNMAHFLNPLAKNALIRRNEWKTKEEAYDYFSEKKLFSKVSKEALNDYVNHGLKHNKKNNLTLKCDPKWESACFQLNTKEVWNEVEHLKIPIKIILTKNSVVCNKFSQERIKKLAPQTEIVFIENTTHMLPLEASEEVSEEINKFL
jgi:pimeloyl-ACP methyl ester carboxylesterase